MILLMTTRRQELLDQIDRLQMEVDNLPVDNESHLVQLLRSEGVKIISQHMQTKSFLTVVDMYAQSDLTPITDEIVRETGYFIKGFRFDSEHKTYIWWEKLPQL